MKTSVTLLSIITIFVIATTSLRAVTLESGQAAKPTAESRKSTAKGESANQALSYGIAEIVKMVEAGVDVSTIETYVQSSPTAYNPSAQDIVQLHEQGVPSSIITAVIRHGKELREKWAQSQPAQSQVPSQQTAPASPNNGLSAQPTYVRASAPQNYYASPSYTYPAYYPSYSYYPNYSYFYPYYSYYPYYSSYFCSAPFYNRYRSCGFQGYRSYVGTGFRYGRNCGNFVRSGSGFHGSVRVGNHGGGAARHR